MSALDGANGDMARAVLDAVLRAALEVGKPVSAAVVDAVGALLAFHRMDGAPRYSADFAIAKAKTSATFGTPTSALEELYATRPAFAQSFIAQGGYFLGRGGVPIVRDGVVLGALGVSGADAHGRRGLRRLGPDAPCRAGRCARTAGKWARTALCTTTRWTADHAALPPSA